MNQQTQLITIPPDRGKQTYSQPTHFRPTREAQKSAVVDVTQENSAKLTNQRVSYAFTSSPLSFHARHILPTSKFQHSYSSILLPFYTTDISEQHV